MRVEPPGEELDRAVVVDGADHAVEVDDTVEEPPGDVALERAQKGVHRHHVPALRPDDVGEVLVALEAERSQREGAIALAVGRVLSGHVDLLHDRRVALVWQMSSQRSTVSRSRERL